MLNGKIVVITGATSVIGKETKNEIIQRTGNKNIDVFNCDLASFESIRNFYTEFKTKYDQLHVLINNEGTWDFKRKESKDGIENIFATNYLAPFLMTNLLLDVIQKSKP